MPHGGQLVIDTHYLGFTPLNDPATEAKRSFDLIAVPGLGVVMHMDRSRNAVVVTCGCEMLCHATLKQFGLSFMATNRWWQDLILAKGLMI